MKTKFEQVYNCFYSKITDDMYMELDEAQTKAMSEELLLNAMPWFEFPRKNIHNYDLEKKRFNVELDYEEINILATYMMISWLDQQLATVELIRMKYSGSDFKFTSQANHMSKLLALKKDYERVGFHLQRLYKRRKADANGIMKSTFGSIMATSVREGNVNQVTSSQVPCCNGDLEWEDFSEIQKDPDPEPEPPSEDDTWEDMKDLPEADDLGSNWEEMS